MSTATEETELGVLTDVQLIRQYERIRRLGRTPDGDVALAEITRRARYQTYVDDPENGLSYVFDEDSDSVRREDRGRIGQPFLLERARALRNAKEREKRLGARAVHGDGTARNGRVLRDPRTMGG